MRFGAPEFIKWLLLIIPLVVLAIWMHRRHAARLAGLISSKVWKTVIPGYNPKRIRRRTTLRLLALFCILLALTRPQWGYKMEEVKQRGLDIIVVLDTSKSMLAADIKPNRLQQAQWAINNFVRHLKGDRIGLIAFAGSSFLQCPVTIDYAAFSMTLNDLYAGIIPKGGTAIAQALETAEKSFDTETAADRVIILITDGEDHTGDPLKIAKKLKQKQIKLFSIGVGTASGELIPAADGRGYLKDEQGRVIKSTLNETLLEQLARETGGFYVRSAPGDFGLDRIYALGISNLQRDEQETRLAKIYKERTGYFIAAALLLLLAETLLTGATHPGLRPPLRRRGTFGIPSSGGVPERRGGSLALLLLLFCIPNAEAKNWRRAYRAGDYTNAFQGLEKMTKKVPSIGNYNRGNALYRMKDFQGSEKAYAEAAAQADNEELKQKALYNRGVALLAGTTKKSAEQLDETLADTATAIELFEQTSDQWNAKQNLERALALQKKLEQQKKEEEKKQDEEKDKKDEQQKNDNEEQEKPDEPEKPDPSDEQEQQDQKQQDKEQQNQEQSDGDQGDEQQQQPQPQQQAGEMSEEEAQQLLDAMKQNEKDQRANLRPYLGQPIRVDKDW